MVNCQITWQLLKIFGAWLTGFYIDQCLASLLHPLSIDPFFVLLPGSFFLQNHEQENVRMCVCVCFTHPSVIIFEQLVSWEATYGPLKLQRTYIKRHEHIRFYWKQQKMRDYRMVKVDEEFGVWRIFLPPFYLLPSLYVELDKTLWLELNSLVFSSLKIQFLLHLQVENWFWQTLNKSKAAFSAEASLIVLFPSLEVGVVDAWGETRFKELPEGPAWGAQHQWWGT